MVAPNIPDGVPPQPADKERSALPAGQADPGPDRQQLAALQNEVITAVRGAITGVMARNAHGADMPDLDLDFSVGAASRGGQLPVLRAEPQRAIALPADPLAGPVPRWRPAAALAALLVGSGVAAGLYFAGSRSGPKLAPDPVPVAMSTAAVPAPAKPGLAALTLAPVTLPAPSRPQTAALPVPVATVLPPSAAAAVALPKSTDAPGRDAVDSAHDLVAMGKVTEARAVLLAAKDPDRSAVALMLARSYDPNFLDTLPSPNAKADIAEAKRWYTHWYDLALKEGAVPQTMRLDLLLRSLDKAARNP